MNDDYIIGKDIDFISIGIGDIDEAMRFQSEIIDGMENREWFTPLTRQEFVIPIEGRDNVYFLKHNNELIGLAVATCDISEVLKEYNIKDSNIMLIDSIMIKQEYRGHHLQKQILELLEKRARELNLDGLVATVHPDNIYSKINFVNSGYDISHLALLHGGDRLVFVKKLVEKSNL